MELCGATKQLNKDNINMVLYHGSCTDGFGSAFVIWYYYKTTYSLERANEIKYVPCYHQKNLSLSENFISDLSGRDVIMCDFSYKYDQLIKIIDAVNTFMILDHHKTAEEDLQKIPDELKIFDMKRSGCGITWDFFYQSTPMPSFLSFIQDRDLWTNRLADTSAFITYLFEQEFKFELWEDFLNEDNVTMARMTGSAWLEYKRIIIDKIVRKTSFIIQEINDQYYIVLYCNSSEFKSDVSNMCMKKYLIGDFACVWDYDLYRNTTMCSLRSTAEKTDVSSIAKLIGGGGHRNASGVSIEGIVDTLPFKRVNDNDFIRLLLHNTKNSVVIGDNTYAYTLFSPETINQEWFSEKYIDLLKRKCDDSILLVFEQISDKVDIKDQNVIPLKQYSIFYNEKAIKQLDVQLQFIVCATKNRVLSFETTLDFSEVFTGNTVAVAPNTTASDDEEW